MCNNLKFISEENLFNLLNFVFLTYFYLVYHHLSLFHNFEIFGSEPPKVQNTIEV